MLFNCNLWNFNNIFLTQRGFFWKCLFKQRVWIERIPRNVRFFVRLWSKTFLLCLSDEGNTVEFRFQIRYFISKHFGFLDLVYWRKILDQNFTQFCLIKTSHFELHSSHSEVMSSYTPSRHFITSPKTSQILEIFPQNLEDLEATNAKKSIDRCECYAILHVS